jgi:hypothetical protein
MACRRRIRPPRDRAVPTDSPQSTCPHPPVSLTHVNQLAPESGIHRFRVPFFSPISQCSPSPSGSLSAVPDRVICMCPGFGGSGRRWRTARCLTGQTSGPLKVTGRGLRSAWSEATSMLKVQGIRRRHVSSCGLSGLNLKSWGPLPGSIMTGTV